jgi:hypothetical protein
LTRTATKPHARSKVEKRIGMAAPRGDPWAERIREAVYAEYHPWQADAASDPSRLKTILTGRGGGKTTTLKGIYLVALSSIANGKLLYACPTLGMAIELLWEPLKQSCSQLGLEQGSDVNFVEAPREGGKIVTFRTGTRLKLFGADDAKQINLCRGQPFDLVGGDEVGFWPIDLVDNFVRKVIMPRIGERNGTIVLASSPGRDPRGFFHDRTRDGSPLHRPYRDRKLPEFANWQGWSSHAWNLADVVKLPQAEKRYPALCALRRSHVHIKNEVEKWSDQNPIWLREYEGRWARDNTAAVFQFAPDRNLWRPAGTQHGVDGLPLLKLAIAALAKDHEWRFVVAIDKGAPRVSKDAANENATDARERRDPWAVNVYAFAPSDPRREMLHVCYFPERAGLYARLIAQLLLGADDQSPTGCRPHEKPGGVLGLIGWPDAMVMDADGTTIEELKNVYGLQFEKAEKKPEYKAGAIELTNGDLVDGRIKAIEDSPLHKQLAELQWAEQESGALKEDPSQPNHSSDTLIYARKLVARMYEAGLVVRESDSRAPMSYADPMGLGGDDDELGAGADDAFDSWMHGQADDWGV